MAFNPDEYETVEVRINRAMEAHPDMRIITEDYTTELDRQSLMWRVKTTIYLTAEDQAAGLPKATGHAFEIDGVGMAQKTAALETCETSSIGRALANMNMSGSKRTTREEMEKVQRGRTPAKPAKVPTDYLDRLHAAADLKALETIWNEAVEGGFGETVKAVVFEKKATLS